jgi:hypothetical protein
MKFKKINEKQNTNVSAKQGLRIKTGVKAGGIRLCG